MTALDVERITTMPVQPPWEGWACPSGAPGRPLYPVQAAALHLLSTRPAPLGLIGAVAVGAGKTGIAWLAPTVVPCERPVIMTSPDLVPQMHRDRVAWAEHYDLHPATRVVPYSALSATSGASLLEDLQPDLLVLDEAHLLRHRSSARTRRVLRYARRNPSTRFVVMSGTLTSKSLYEMAHLLELALRGGTPTPLNDHVLRAWDAVISVEGEPSRDDTLMLRALLAWAGEDNPRRAFQKRLRCTPGVIATTEGAIGTSLLIRTVEVPGSAALVEAQRDLLWHWKTPDGRELAEASERGATLANLELGFHYVPVWPKTTPRLVQVAWTEARLEWQRTVNGYLQHGARQGMDSPALLARAAKHGRLHAAATATWEAWEAIRHSTLPPVPTPVWVDDSPLRRARARARGQFERALLVYRSKAVEEKLESLGYSVFGQGSDAPPDHLDFPAVSQHVHGKGKNLQAWDTMVVLEAPASGGAWEQLLGRIHRPGQTSDLCVVEVINGAKRLEKATEDAVYIEDTTGQKQKLGYCSWDAVELAGVRAP
jgi:hypothetical protein